MAPKLFIDVDIRLSCSRHEYLLYIHEMNIHDRREDHVPKDYRLDTANSNTVNLKFHLIQSLDQLFARFLSFHV